MSIGAIGDLHLGKIDHWVPKAHLMQLSAVERILQACKREGVTDVVFLGDLYDNPSPPQELQIMLASLLIKFSFRYHFLLGNHDRHQKDKHSLVITDWLGKNKFVQAKVYLEPELVKIGAHRYWFCSHPYVVPCPDSRAVISFGHYARTGARRDNGSIEDKGQAPKGKLWVLGDYHTPQEGEGYIYAGTTTQVSFGESQAKRWLLIDGKTVRSKPLPTDKQPYLLEMVNVHSEKELVALRKRQIANDKAGKPVTYLSIVFKDGFRPEDGAWAKQIPHKLLHSYDSAAQTTASPSFNLGVEESPLAGLADWLKSRDGLTTGQRKWAETKAQKLMLGS